MFIAIAIILFVLWLVGLVSGATVGLWLHLLLLFALISLFFGIVQQAHPS